MAPTPTPTVRPSVTCSCPLSFDLGTCWISTLVSRTKGSSNFCSYGSRKIRVCLLSRFFSKQSGLLGQIGFSNALRMPVISAVLKQVLVQEARYPIISVKWLLCWRFPFGKRQWISFTMLIILLTATYLGKRAMGRNKCAKWPLDGAMTFQPLILRAAIAGLENNSPAYRLQNIPDFDICCTI